MSLDTERHDRLVRLEAALRWYADRANYQQTGWQGDPNPAPIQGDAGHRAREALKEENT